MLPKLYSSLSDWWPLFSAPTEYEEEAGIYQTFLEGDVPGNTPLTLLELGSGGGNDAFYLKDRFEMTLSDISEGMLAHSRKLNPDCEHVKGDLRKLRLHREFDRVFVHDAICYMVTPQDLQSAMTTAFIHCRPGGLAVFAPDYVRETFEPSTDHGGHDGHKRSIRFLEWTWDPDASDSQYTVDYTLVMRSSDGTVRTEQDRHIEGLFSREEWLTLLRSVGFEPRIERVMHSEVERPLELFVAARPLTTP